MSVLDMFASALGAFIMCAIILFPYYRETKDFQDSIDKTKEAVQKSAEDLQSAQQKMKRGEDTRNQLKRQLRASQTSTTELNQCRADATACKAALQETFLLVVIEWSERCDVDLYVKDPSGREYSYRTKKHDGSDAELSLDMRDGPGIEVWQVPVATAGNGTYEVAYQAVGGQSDTVTVRGVQVDRSGRHELPTKQVQCRSGRTKVATLEVSSSGIVSRRTVVGD